VFRIFPRPLRQPRKTSRSFPRTAGLLFQIIDRGSTVDLVQSTMPYQAIRTRKLLAAFWTFVWSFFRVAPFVPPKVFRFLSRAVKFSSFRVGRVTEALNADLKGGIAELKRDAIDD
jgi:hypothetical protein